MDLARIAGETLEIIERGEYRTPSGRTVAVRGSIDAAVGGTILYTPQDVEALVSARTAVQTSLPVGQPTRVEVTPETTTAARWSDLVDRPRRRGRDAGVDWGSWASLG